MNPEAPYISFSIFAGSLNDMRYGESILLRTPCGKLGLIDCCLGHTAHPAALLEFGFPSEELDFVLLTHPHKDHFIGLPEILGSRDAKIYYKYYGTRLEPPSDLSTREGYVELLKSLSAEFIGQLSRPFDEKSKLLSIQEQLAKLFSDDGRHWYPLHAEKSTSRKYDDNLVIEAISPSDENCWKIDQLHAKHFDGLVSFLKDPLTNEEALNIDEEAIDEPIAEIFRNQANRLSVCLSVRWGSFRGLLLADAEPDVLQEAFAKDPQWFYDVSFVKVAHHGGSGANPRFAGELTLFEYLQKNRTEGKPLIAAVTHFNKILPSRSSLDEIAQCCDRLYLATEPSVLERYSPEYQEWDEFPETTRDSVSEKEWKTRHVLRPTDEKEGWFELKFGKTGTLLNDHPKGAILWPPQLD